MCWIFVYSSVEVGVTNFSYFQTICAASFDDQVIAVKNDKDAMEDADHCFSGVLSIRKNREN